MVAVQTPLYVNVIDKKGAKAQRHKELKLKTYLDFAVLQKAISFVATIYENSRFPLRLCAFASLIRRDS